ncbi:hypothetical protein QCA50_005236 [Cerrena zonata]|uniref:MYND-type domain-containing protein n=1 Tax=Cerrena zonata TaxID=2478898 RepID=A0AAW0GJ11_9APHY
MSRGVRRGRAVTTSFRSLVQTVDKAPWTTRGDLAAGDIARLIIENRFPYYQATIDRIFGLLRSHWDLETLATIETRGHVPPELAHRFKFTSIWSAIGTLASRFSRDSSCTFIRDAFAAHKDSIVRWMQVIVDFCYNRDLSHEDRFRLFSLTWVVLHPLIDNDHLRAMILSDTRIYTVTLRMWLLGEQFPCGSAHIQASNIFSYCLVFLYTRQTRIDIEGFTINPDLDKFTSAALNYLRAASRLSNWSSEHVLVHLTILFRLYALFVGIPRVMIQKGVASDMTSILRAALQRLSGVDRIVPQTSEIPILEQTIGILFQITLTVDGIPCLVETIQHGLLRLLIQCDPYLDYLGHFDQSKSIPFFISSFLPQYCIFQSVLEAAQDELRKMAQEGLGSEISYPPLREAWGRLGKIVKAHGRILDLVRNDPIRIFQTCDGPNCQTKETECRFRRCLGCIMMYYCSVECQQAHWQSHKDLCQQQSRIYTEVTCIRLDIPRHDIKSLKKMIAYYLTVMSNSPRYRQMFEESRLGGVSVQFAFCGEPFQLPTVEREGGPPGIRVSTAVRWGASTRTLSFRTSLAELKNNSNDCQPTDAPFLCTRNLVTNG